MIFRKVLGAIFVLAIAASLIMTVKTLVSTVAKQSGSNWHVLVVK